MIDKATLCPSTLPWIETGSTMRSEMEGGIYSVACALSELAQRGAIAAEKIQEFLVSQCWR